MPEQGCTTRVTEDEENCGGCDVVCPDNEAHSSPFCASGSCSHACASGWGDCNGNLDSDGCETDLSSNPSYCGSCSQDCSSGAPAHTSAGCSGGFCVYTCEADWGNCDDNMSSNGCELDLQGNDEANCGACDFECGVDHPDPYCVDGYCVSGLPIQCARREVYHEDTRIDDSEFSFSSTLQYGPGQHRLLLLSFASDGGSTPTGATYGSHSMRALSVQSHQDYRVAMYYLLESDLGSDGSGSYPVTVSLSGDQCQRGHAAVLHCMNARQAAPPLKSATTGGASGNTVTFTAGENPEDNSWLLSHVYYQNGDTAPSSSELSVIGTRIMGSYRVGAGYRDCGAAGACSSPWTWSGTCNNSLQTIALIKPGIPD